jgi:hypothetical protein
MDVEASQKQSDRQEGVMHLTRRDRIATVCVGGGVLVAVLWLAGVGSEGITTVRIVTAIVLALGFVASASAVVPGFVELLHGSKLYLAITSLIGLGALAAGIAALVDGSEVMLGLLVVATIALWVISTARHTRWASTDAGALGKTT